MTKLIPIQVITWILDNPTQTTTHTNPQNYCHIRHMEKHLKPPIRIHFTPTSTSYLLFETKTQRQLKRTLLLSKR